MTITFRCERCSKPFTVAAAQAGRQGRCKGCGQGFTVPIAVEADAYALAEAPAEPTFVHAPREDDEAPPRPIGRGSGGPRVSNRKRREVAARRAVVIKKIVGG